MPSTDKKVLIERGKRLGLSNRTHGHSTPRKSKTYLAWSGAKMRCTARNQPQFAVYGGRGIKMCERWLNSFEHFLADMGERPDGLSLDRIDVNGNYEPGNCRWVTRAEQNRNMRRNVCTWEKARGMRSDVAGGMLQKEAAVKYAVHRAIVSAVILNKLWRVEDDPDRA